MIIVHYTAIENVSSKLGSNHSDMWSDADDKNSGGGDYNSGSSPEDRSIGTDMYFHVLSMYVICLFLPLLYLSRISTLRLDI